MIVEFCGVPGGGKSTRARDYAAAHPQDVALVTIDMYRRLPELGYAILFFLHHPISFFWLWVFAATHHMKGLFWYSLHLSLRAAAKYQKAQLIAGKDALIDEGLVHIVMTLPARPFTQAETLRWLKRFPLPDAAWVAAEGSFHRFEEGREVTHPRAAGSREALQAWREAVRANVATVDFLISEAGVERWKPKGDYNN